MYYGEEIGMSNARFSLATAQDPIPRKFKFLPRFLFDRLGLMVNRDEVRTPMQWDASKNAGFSTAEETWLPVHGNFPEVNVENQRATRGSLLNTVRAVLKIRRQEPALQEGFIELLPGLPPDVLGYARQLGNERIVVLLNFGEQIREFQFEVAEALLKLSDGDEIQQKTIRLDSYGGVVLKVVARRH
jgi:glycosidase